MSPSATRLNNEFGARLNRGTTPLVPVDRVRNDSALESRGIRGFQRLHWLCPVRVEPNELPRSHVGRSPQSADRARNTAGGAPTSDRSVQSIARSRTNMRSVNGPAGPWARIPPGAWCRPGGGLDGIWAARPFSLESRPRAPAPGPWWAPQPGKGYLVSLGLRGESARPIQVTSFPSTFKMNCPWRRFALRCV
jgi:hypothetical protein